MSFKIAQKSHLWGLRPVQGQKREGDLHNAEEAGPSLAHQAGWLHTAALSFNCASPSGGGGARGSLAFIPDTTGKRDAGFLISPPVSSGGRDGNRGTGGWIRGFERQRWPPLNCVLRKVSPSSRTSEASVRRWRTWRVLFIRLQQEPLPDQRCDGSLWPFLYPLPSLTV